jgi:predicted dehydrogenase/aryl-alcohol dehydrogenase-like predicted oxidoreductase
MLETKTVRWGILGTGTIARQFAASLRHGSSSQVSAVASRSNSVEPINEFAGARFHVGYDALLADRNVDAVYVATPHPTHAKWAIRAAQAGKHILCEKPLGMNAAEADAIIDAARRHRVFLMEAFMYRTHEQTRKLAQLLQAGAIGDVRLIHASFGFQKAFDPAARHFANDLGGGAILDLGCYCTSLARLVAGIAGGRPFADPIEVHGAARLTPTGVDEQAVAMLRFPNDVMAQLSVSMTFAQDNVARIYGTKGRIEVASPWLCTGRQGGKTIMTVRPTSEAPQEIVFETEDWLYAIEAEAFAKYLIIGEPVWPAPSWADTVSNMKALDSWRKAAGVEYESEKPGGYAAPLSGRPLTRLQSAKIPAVRTPDIGKPLAKIALGCADLLRVSDMAVVLDAYFEEGGTVIDTAHAYGYGRIDTMLGHWVKSRGVREQIAIIGKGAHRPCRPDVISQELDESLERLKTDYLDIYFLHRDNLDIPVGEFVDVLDQEHRSGRIRMFGGSNWSLARVDEANDYAARTKRKGFQALSNQFSLAEMVEPVWTGCLSASSDSDIAWLKQRNIPLFAWSSQARGFFTDRAGRDKQVDPAFMRSWYSDQNFARRDRAQQLAVKYKTTLSRVALAYVLAQDFSIFPLIGPLTLREFHDALGALDIRLTLAEVLWLRNGH